MTMTPRPPTAEDPQGSLISAAPGAKYAGPLPRGWSQCESRTNPGLFYFVTPDGPTWRLPSFSSASAAAQGTPARKDPKTTVYRHDFQHWKDTSTFNPAELNDGMKASASYALHPRAGFHPSHFVSTHRHDYTVKTAPPLVPRNPFPACAPAHFEETSTYRADFAANKGAARPQTCRARTPPRTRPFGHTSTHRADYVDFHPRRPKIVRPVPKLHFNSGGPINSTYRQDFTAAATATARLPRVKPPATHLNQADADNFCTEYGCAYVKADCRVPRATIVKSMDIDRSIVNRCNAHKELHDLE